MTTLQTLLTSPSSRDTEPARKWCPWTPPAPPGPPRPPPMPPRHRMSPVLEGEVVRVDQPGGHPATGWPTWPPGRRTAARSSRRGCGPAARRWPPLKWVAGALPARGRLPRHPHPEVRRQARRPHARAAWPAGAGHGAVDVRPGRPPGADGRRAQGRPGGLPEAVPPARRPGPAAGLDRRAGRARRAGRRRGGADRAARGTVGRRRAGRGRLRDSWAPRRTGR